MRKIFLIAAVVLVAIAGSGWWFVLTYQDAPLRSDFPKDPGVLTVESLASGQTLTQRFDVDGSAYSAWADEGKIPMSVVGEDGALVWEGYATMPEWTSDAVVPFHAHVDVGRFTGPAAIVIDRSNQTDDSSYDKETRVPVVIGNDPADDKYPYDPGQITIYSALPGDVLGRTFALQGSASTRWFDEKRRIAATVFASDGVTILWKGYATTSDDVKILHVADFSLSADVGAYLGDITVSFSAANPDGDRRYDAKYPFDAQVQ